VQQGADADSHTAASSRQSEWCTFVSSQKEEGKEYTEKAMGEERELTNGGRAMRCEGSRRCGNAGHTKKKISKE